MNPQDLASELAPLEAFVGKWQTEGELRSESGAAGTFTATDEYEWLEGRFFLVHRWNARMPDGPNSGIEVIGYDRESRGFTLHSYDNQGNAGTMRGRAEGSRWDAGNELLRFEGRFSKDRTTLTGTWSRRASAGESWVPWLDVRLRKLTT